MSSTKKANQWYFGMKAHLGVDQQNRIVHSLETSTAKEHDSQKAQALLHGEEEVAAGDSAYSSNVRSVSGYEHGVYCG